MGRSHSMSGCKKGNRECVYPDPPSSKATGSSSKAARSRASVPESDSSSDTSDNDDDVEGLETIQDEETGSGDVQDSYPPVSLPKQSAAEVSRKQSHRSSTKTKPLSKPPSKPSSVFTDKSLSPSTDASSTFSSSYPASASSKKPGKLASHSSNTSKESSPTKLDFSQLPRDIQHFLEYHQVHLTHHHYFFKHDAGRFLHTTFLEIAVKFEPLLHAVVGFAAFHQSLRKQNGRIQDFLHYYNKSVSLLRRSLQSGKRNTDATLLTILQLATFEVCLARHAVVFNTEFSLRNTWATGLIYLAIKEPHTKCWLSSTTLPRLCCPKSDERSWVGIPASTSLQA